MDNLAQRYADRAVSSIFIYVREAHPGEKFPSHRCIDDKRKHARSFKEQFSVRRKIFLDDLEGTVHRAYGMVPNMTWIIGRGGLVFYKAGWTVADDVEDALNYTLKNLAKKRDGQTIPFYTERLSWRTRDEEKFKAGLERSGPQALRDFYTKETDEFLNRLQQ